MPIEDDPTYPTRMEALLQDTPGVVWHGPLSREATTALVAEGGIALNVWDYRFGPRMNDLRRLDEVLPGLRDRLRARRPDPDADAGRSARCRLSAVRRRASTRCCPSGGRILADADLYRSAASRAFEASRAYTYPAVHRLIAPYLAGSANKVDRDFVTAAS